MKIATLALASATRMARVACTSYLLYLYEYTSSFKYIKHVKYVKTYYINVGTFNIFKRYYYHN